MGGCNSGGGRWAPKTHDFHKIDLASLKRLGMDKPGFSGSLIWSIRGRETGRIGILTYSDRCVLNYRSRSRGSDWETISDVVYFDWTTTGLCGKRKWFLCPKCGRRCRVLYGGKYFRCRECVGAVYESQYEPSFHACHQRVRRLKQKLGDGDADTFDPIPPKPKGMHWKTYFRICDEIDDELDKLNGAFLAYAQQKGFKFGSSVL